MPNRDLHSTYKAVQHLECKAYTTTQTPASGVDLQGFDSVDFLIMVGVVTSGNASPLKGWEFTLEESDSASTGFTTVTDSNQTLTGSAKSPETAPDSTTGIFLTVSTQDQETYRIGYRGNKRYARLVSTAVNSPGSTPLGIVALLGNASQTPTAD